MDKVMVLGAEKPVVIFSKTSCCMSHTIKLLICSFGANPSVLDLDEVPYGEEVEKALQALGCNPTLPAVFIGKRFIGGSNEIMSLNVRGELKPLLIKARAIWI